MLTSRFSKEYIETALNQLHLDKALRPDDFPVCFFQKCWYFLGTDMMEAVENMRNSD